MSAPSVSSSGPFVVEVPIDEVGPVTVELRRGGSVLGSMTLPAPVPGSQSDVESAVVESDTLGSDRASPASEASLDERGRELVEIACDVISEKGFAATSMRDIARAADVPIATMYRHIGSKDELLYTITATRMQGLFDHFDEHLGGGDSAAERLADAIGVYVSYISENHRYINLVYRETKALGDDARTRIYATERRFMEQWEDIIRDGVAAGEFEVDDVELAANLAYFACTVWALRHWSIGDRSEEAVAALLTRMVLGGLTVS